MTTEIQSAVYPIEEKVIDLEFEIERLKAYRDKVIADEELLVLKANEIVELKFEVQRLKDTISVYKGRIDEMAAALHNVASDSMEDLVFSAHPKQLGAAMFSDGTVYLHFDSLTRELNYLETAAGETRN